MNTPISTADLIRWIEGVLPPEESAHLADRVDHDADASARAAWLRTFMANRRTAILEDPPGTLRDHLTAQFRRHHGIHTGELVFDSRHDGVLVRSGLTRQAWSTVHAAPALDIAIDLRPADDGLDDAVQVTGQLMRGEAAEDGEDQSDRATVQWRGPGGWGETPCDEDGHFSVGRLTPGRYVVTVLAACTTVAIDVELPVPDGG